MEKINSKLEIVTNFINSILRKKKLVIFIGGSGIKIIAYHKSKGVDSVFADYNDKEYFTVCCAFLKGYKKYQVLILLDSPECQINHEFMPMLQSILKSNPVEKFIQDNYKPEDIIAYNVYNVDNDHRNGELWETIIASSTYSDSTNQLLEFVIYNSFRFNGIYFLSLEFESIVNAILRIQNRTDCQNDLQIFVNITEASNIRVATKYKKNILDELTIDFPSDKSDLYIAGTIEQAISDQVLKYKAYTKSLDLKICLIFLCDKTLCDILEKMPSLQVNKIIKYNTDSTLAENRNQHFQDNSLLALFMENKKYLALNKLLRSITNLTAINSFAFKPLFLILVGIIIFLSSLKYQSILIQKETIAFNSKYYLSSEKYRSMKKRHPEIENITNLTELYNLQKILSIKSLTPAVVLKKLFSINNPNIEVVNINWYAEGTNLTDRKILLTFDVTYVSNKKERKIAEKTLREYTDEVRLIFQDYKVTYVADDNVVELPNSLTIWAKITISNKTAGRDVR